MKKRFLALLPLAVVLSFTTKQAAAHDWYSHLVDPFGASCCGGEDCHPVPPGMTKRVKDSYFIYFKDQWYIVPPERILAIQSPDGQVHACFHHFISSYEGDSGPARQSKGQAGDTGFWKLLCVVLPWSG
jgi:hypothetical protein